MSEIYKTITSFKGIRSKKKKEKRSDSAECRISAEKDLVLKSEQI